MNVLRNTVASKSIAAETNNDNFGSRAEGAIDRAGAKSLTVRRIAPAIARLEIQAIRLADRAADTSLNVISVVLGRFGAVCIAAAERAREHQKLTNQRNQ